MSQTGVVSWSKTAASNASADSNINWAEGMAPSQVNDSARAEMASVAKWRDDNAGTLISSGGGTAHTVSTNQAFSSLAVLDGQTIRVRFGFTNGASPTLAVDGLTAKPIQVDSLTAIAQGAIRVNSIHGLTYDNSLGAFIVHHGHSLVEPGRIAPHAMTAAPAGWLLCDGTGVSRTTYADLFANISTTFGSSDGASFKVPDLTGRVPAGKEGSATRLTAAVSGVDGGTLGAGGGTQSHALSVAELAAHDHHVNITDPGHTHGPGGAASNFVTDSGTGTPGGATTGGKQSLTASAQTNITATAATTGSGTAHTITQPTLIVNYFIKT